MATSVIQQVESMNAFQARKALEAVRDRLEAGCHQYFGAASTVELVQVSEHTYSSTGVLRVRSGQQTRTLIAKIVDREGDADPSKTGQAEREHEALARCAEIFRGSDSVGAPAPVASFPDLHAIVMERVEGTSLSAVLAEARFWPSNAKLRVLERLCRQCGEWVGRLQKATAATARAGSLDLLASCRNELAYLAGHPIPPVTDEFIATVGSHVVRLGARLEGQPIAVAGTHGGLGPYNVIVSPDRRKITVIDFAGFRTDSVYADYFKFRGRLEMLAASPAFSRRVVRRLVAAFTEGYARPVDDSAPLSRILQIGFVLDRMTAYVEGARTGTLPLRQRLPRRLLFRRHYQWLSHACRT
jgi:hypothetical protein